MNESIFIDRHGKGHQKPSGATVHERPTGYALVRDHAGLILVVQPVWHRLWELPGGGINPGEDLLTGIRREVMEETGYTVHPSEHPLHMAVERFYDLADERRFFRARISVHAALLDGPRRPRETIPATAVKEIARIAWLSRSELTRDNCQRIHWPVLERIG